MPRLFYKVVVGLFFAVAGVAFCCATALGAPRVKVDGKVLRTSPAPVIRGGKVYVPIDAFGKLGLYVDYKAGARRGRIGLPDSDAIIDVEVGRMWIEPLAEPPSDHISVPGKPFMRSRSLMVPIGIVLTSFDREFAQKWDKRSQTLRITRDAQWLKWRLKEKHEKQDPKHYVKPI